jgi:hypothetical protein
MVNRSDLIAASACSRSSFRDCSSRSSLRKRRSSEAPRLQNLNSCLRHSLGLRCAGIRPCSPRQVVVLHAPPLRRRVPLQSTHRTPSPSTYWASPRLRWRASDHRPRQRLCGRISDGPGGSRCRRRQQVRRAWSHGCVSGLPRHDGRPDRGVSLGGLPHGKSRRLGPPLEGALHGGQPTSLARRGTSCRSRFRLEGLPGVQTGQALPPLAERKSKIKTHREKTKTEVSSDTYPLRTRASRACGEAPRTLVPAGAAKGCPAADSGAASTSGARGTEGATCTGVVTTIGGSTPCAAGMGACSWGTSGSA